MIIVYRAEHLIDAHLVKHRLEQLGIEAHVFGGHLTGGMGELPALGLCTVVVRDDDAQAALNGLADFKIEMTDAIEDDFGEPLPN